MRLDCMDKFPSGMEEYLSQNGWHFNKKMCNWAVSKMTKLDSTGKSIKITPYTKDDVDDILKRHNITLTNDLGYDSVYIANMCMADYYNSSISDENKLALFIKDTIDDPDGYCGKTFTRFYADCIGLGKPIIWEDMI